MGVVDFRFEAEVPKSMTLVFTYGTLKRGFSNHTLMQDMMREGDAVFVGSHITEERYPLVCGPFRVPFLLNMPGEEGAKRVVGELYAVSGKGLAKLDELEGTTRGHYERLPIKVVPSAVVEERKATLEAEAYFGHRSFTAEMWIKCQKRGYRSYGQMESFGYVRRKDRPQGKTFLDHIQAFVASNPIASV